MATFTIVPSSLTFTKTRVRGPVAALEATAETKTFIFTNRTGSTVKITGVGYTDGLENDSVTQPGGLGASSDFSIVPTGSQFPATVTNNSTQSFTVTFAPKRSSQGFDVRSRILSLVNNAGLNLKIPVGGPVIEIGYDAPTTHPIMGLPAVFTIADLDTGRHAVSAIELYSGVAAGNSAAGVRVGARAVQVLVYGMDTATVFDLTISVVTSGGNVAIKTWTGLTYATIGNLFLTNNGGYDLQGLPLYAAIANVTNPNSVTIKIGVVVLG